MNRGAVVRDGVRLVWTAEGSGEPLLLIHGLGYDRFGWGPVTALLAERFRVIAFDNRGVGESGDPQGPYTTAEMAADAAAVLEDAGAGRAHVVGTSLGGMIAQHLALSNPGRVATLVLSATTPGGTEAYPTPSRTVDLFAAFANDPSPAQLRRLVENGLSPLTVEARPELVEEILRYRLAHPPRSEPWLAQAAAGAAFSSFPDLGRLDVPTLVLHGRDDAVVDHRNGELLAGAIRDAELLLVPGTGHLGFWEHPGDFVDAVVDFVGRRGGPAQPSS
jgi:pimeloyl-ACP methyl ester carboxylesterase